MLWDRRVREGGPNDGREALRLQRRPLEAARTRPLEGALGLARGALRLQVGGPHAGLRRAPVYSALTGQPARVAGLLARVNGLEAATEVQSRAEYGQVHPCG